MTVQFNVHFDMQANELQGKNVLVFLSPHSPSSNITAHAWRVLTAPAGATESFAYDGVVSVVAAGFDADSKRIASADERMTPGQLLLAMNPAGSSDLKLPPAPSSLAQLKLTPYQYGVLNQTNPFVQLDCTWYVAGAPAVTVSAIDANMTATFELPGRFYFVVAEPPQAGEGVAQAFSDTTQYIPPITAKVVDVSLTREQGLWTFTFAAS